MATDLGVTRPPAKLSRHLRPPGWGSHSLLVCPSEGYSRDVELLLPLESRATGPFSGLGLPHPPHLTPQHTHSQSQRNSDLGGTRERGDAAKGDCRNVCKKLGGGEDRREETASEDPLLLPSRRSMPKRARAPRRGEMTLPPGSGSRHGVKLVGLGTPAALGLEGTV